jgi:hypothetical protein
MVQTFVKSLWRVVSTFVVNSVQAYCDHTLPELEARLSPSHFDELATTKIICFQLTDTQFPDHTTHQIPFISKELCEALKRCGLPYIEIDGSQWPSPYDISRVLNQAYIYCTNSEETEELAALQDKLRPWQLRDIFSHGSVNNLASSLQFQGEEHREYLLEVLEFLRWKDTLVCVDSEGRVSPEGKKKLHTLLRVDAEDRLILRLLPRTDDLELVHSVPWDMATQLPGLLFERCHFVTIPVHNWSWFKTVIVDDKDCEQEVAPDKADARQGDAGVAENNAGPGADQWTIVNTETTVSDMVRR